MVQTVLFLAFLFSLDAFGIARPAAPFAPDAVPTLNVVRLATPEAGASGYGTFEYTAAKRQERKWFYIHGTMNVRAEPNQSAAIVRTLRRGEFVQLGPKDANGWAPLYTGGSVEGHVYRESDLVQRQAPAARSTASASGGGGGSRASSGGSRRSSGGRDYHTGPRGGCYYYSGSGRKQYVDRSYCH